VISYESGAERGEKKEEADDRRRNSKNKFAARRGATR